MKSKTSGFKREIKVVEVLELILNLKYLNIKNSGIGFL